MLRQVSKLKPNPKRTWMKYLNYFLASWSQLEAIMIRMVLWST